MRLLNIGKACIELPCITLSLGGDELVRKFLLYIRKSRHQPKDKIIK